MEWEDFWLGYAGQLIVERSAEELLLEFERTGRPEPFEEIVRRYSGMVYHVCYRICRDKHDAEDATQAVFAALAVGRKKESGEIRTIGPWLRQVARRVSLDIRRGQKRRQRRETLCASDGASVDPASEASAGVVGGAGGLDAEEVKQLVKEELERLPAKYRLPLILHYFGGMSQEDMAKELGCRPGTLRVRLHRGRGMLAKRLAKRGVAAGMVVLVVAVTRAVQSAVTDSLAVQFGYGHAATAGGVIQAATSGPTAVAQGLAGVAGSKMKVACALVLIGACVVRAGAEVYEYIRPMQLRVPVPMNLDQMVRPLFDTMMNPMRVDSTPVRPGVETEKADEIAIAEAHRGGPLVEAPPAPVSGGGIGLVGGTGRVVTTPAMPVMPTGPVSARVDWAGGVTRRLGRLGPDYATPGWTWGGSQGLGSGFSGNTGGASGSARRPIVWTPPSEGTGGSIAGPVAPPSVPAPVTPPVVEPPPVAQTPPSEPVVPPTGGSSGGNSTPTALALVIEPTPPVAAPVVPSSAVPNSSLDNLVVVDGASASSLPRAALAVSSSVAASDGGESVTPATPTYRVASRGLTGNGVVTAASVDNSGVVTATASAGPVAAALDLSEVAVVTNTADNPANGRNGWYAGSHAKLVLPKVPVEAGTHSYSWGESADDATPDLVNSVRFTLHDAAEAGDVSMAVVAPDWPGVPAFPAGQRVIGLWAMDADAVAAEGIDVLVRFDWYQAALLGWTDGDVRLLDYRGGWNAVNDGFFIRSDEHVVGGRLGEVSYFAVTVPATSAVQPTYVFVPPGTFAANTPEPACLPLIVGGIYLLSRRRRGSI